MRTLPYLVAPMLLVAIAGTAAAQEDAPAEEVPEGTEPEQAVPAEGEAVAEEATPAEQAAPTPEEVAAEQAQSEADARIADQLRVRNEFRDVHRAMGIATWISMAVTLVLGGLQFHDEYGSENAGSTPCATGRAVVGNDFCFRFFPAPHAISAILTSVLYYTTFTLSFMMPDPLEVANSPGWAGERLRIHKTLRWFHFAGIVATTLFGAITANIDIDYEGQRALAATHLALGVTTYALLTTAAAVILF
jgi:hypothetical protein